MHLKVVICILLIISKVDYDKMIFKYIESKGVNDCNNAFSFEFQDGICALSDGLDIHCI